MSKIIARNALVEQEVNKCLTGAEQQVSYGIRVCVGRASIVVTPSIEASWNTTYSGMIARLEREINAPNSLFGQVMKDCRETSAAYEVMLFIVTAYESLGSIPVQVR